MKQHLQELGMGVLMILAAMMLWWTWRLGSAYVEKKTERPCNDSTPAWGSTCEPNQRMEVLNGKIICRCLTTTPSASSSP